MDRMHICAGPKIFFVLMCQLGSLSSFAWTKRHVACCMLSGNIKRVFLHPISIIVVRKSCMMRITDFRISKIFMIGVLVKNFGIRE